MTNEEKIEQRAIEARLAVQVFAAEKRLELTALFDRLDALYPPSKPIVYEPLRSHYEMW